MCDHTRKLTVSFTKQQLVFLEMLKNEGRHGETMENVMRETFREFIRTTLPKGRS